MRSRYFAHSFSLFLVLSLAARAAENAAEAEGRLRENVTYLASDSLEGRGVGTAGLNQAADLLARKFAEMGLRTELFEGTPFQTFEVVISAEMGPAAKNRLSLVGPSQHVDLKLSENFTPLATGGTAAF